MASTATASVQQNSTAGNQVALTNSFRSYNSKIPMFLQKLYTILEDPTTNEVISWAEDGSSFFVHDHDALAKKHLPHWFKHNKFASFVRQLNMYGFHKVPHLQQGLISGGEASQFMHPFFHRGREDQLVFIERKKQTKDHVQVIGLDAIDPMFDTTGVNTALGGGSDIGANTASGNAIDGNAILAALQTIRRTQAQISQDLAELKEADRVLWDEAQKARDRYEQQQDTINRIVKFLASFISQLGSGHVASQHQYAQQHEKRDGKQEQRQGESERLVPARLMIEAAKTAKSPFAMQPTSVETPGSQVFSPSSPSTLFSEGFPSPSAPTPQRAPSPTPPPFASPTLTHALSNISPADWAKVLGSFQTDFMSPKLVDFAPVPEPVPVPEGLISFDTSCALDLDKIGKTVEDMNGDIASLSSMLGFPALGEGNPLTDISPVLSELSAVNQPTRTSPTNNLRGVPFELSPPPPPGSKKRKPEGLDPSPIATRKSRTE